MKPPDRLASLRAASPDEQRRRVGTGRLGGLLLLAGAALGALAHGSLPDPSLRPPAWAPAGVVAAAGLLSLLLPWRRLHRRWLHVAPAVATVAVTVVVAQDTALGPMFTPLYFPIAAFAAYAFPSRSAVAGHLGLIGAGITLALLGVASPPAGTSGGLLLTVAALVTVTSLMVIVRERMEAGQAALRELAQSDPLTGVGNYRRLYARMSYEMARHRRSGRPLTLLVLDLDGFKAVNDTLGHPAGDRLLCEVADALRATVREQDTVARQGGDEFAVLAPETGPLAAEALGARIERALADIDSDEMPIGASIGWAVFPADGDERMALMECADTRQRVTKHARRAADARAGSRLSA